MEQRTRKKLIDQYKDGYRVVAEALVGATDEDLDARPAPGKWTAREIVHHLADSEMTSAIRLRLLLAAPTPQIIGLRPGRVRPAPALRPADRSLARRVQGGAPDDGRDSRPHDRGRVAARGDAQRTRAVHGRAVARDLLPTHAHKHAEQILVARDAGKHRNSRRDATTSTQGLIPAVPVPQVR